MRTVWELENAFASPDCLDSARRIYFVGIGGASMSALARICLRKGLSVAGSDMAASPLISELLAAGAEVRVGHSKDGLREGDVLVLTDAVDLNASPEVAGARELGLPLLRRSHLLKWLLKGYEVLAVTGTHGKTTTTGLLGAALIGAGEDPFVVCGAEIPEWGSAVRFGEGRYAVIEACEAYDSLRDLDPDWVILTNLEPEHLDFYAGGWDQLRSTVIAFAERAKGLVYCAEDPGACEIAAQVSVETIPYGADQAIDLALTGAMNRLNGAGALTLCRRLGIAGESGLSQFRGAERRMQFVGEAKGVAVWDDYAHHPTEVAASLAALRERAKGRLVVVFQPHLYSRTKDNLTEFAQALEAADLVVITDIYPAREAPLPGVSSSRIAEKIQVPTRYVPSRHLLPREVASLVQPGDTVVGMGAGNIGEFPPALVRELQRSGPKRIAVAYGGDSAEREVSLHSGIAICAALKSAGYEATLLDLSELLLSGGDLRRLTGPERPDLVFLAVHGTNAEDGAIQGLCQMLHLPYTGSDLLSSALAMDKERAKAVLAGAGIRVPKGALVRSGDPTPTLAPPLVVKPNANGSTVGVTFVDRAEELPKAIERALAYDSAVLVEERIVGMEISTPVLGDRALAPVEIVPVSGDYDFDAKYTPGATEEICPARLPEAVLLKASAIALEAHRALGCRGATRTDAMVTPQGEIIVLEVNTLPGMTGTSLLPKSAAHAGLSFPELCAWISEDALARHAQA